MLKVALRARMAVLSPSQGAAKEPCRAGTAHMHVAQTPDIVCTKSLSLTISADNGNGIGYSCLNTGNEHCCRSWPPIPRRQSFPLSAPAAQDVAPAATLPDAKLLSVQRAVGTFKDSIGTSLVTT